VKVWPAVMCPYARLHQKAALSPLQALWQKRPAVPNVQPLCKWRAKLMACALLHFDFIYSDFICWLGGEYTTTTGTGLTFFK
jgi:hypothetical protein